MANQNRMLLVLQIINRVTESQMLLINQKVAFQLHLDCVKLFQFFYHKKKATLSTVTLSKCILMLRENFFKVTIHLIKHTPFMNFGKNGKDTHETIIFDIKFALLFMNEYVVSLFHF